MRIQDKLNQTITYWSPGVPDGFGGMTYGTPEAIQGRWEGQNELFIDAEGNEVRSQSIVYLDQSVQINGYLALGEYTDSTDTDPTTISGAKEIRSVKSTPSVDASQTLYKVWL